MEMWPYPDIVSITCHDVNMKLTTLCYPIVHGRVLLAMKKRGFGVGYWNGPGGKIEAGETALEACIRETKEEVGIDVAGLVYRGTVEFDFAGKPEWNNRCEVFVSEMVMGEAKESEEMLPQWFEFDAVPYDRMWEDDRIWLPTVLRGGTVSSRFYFDGSGHLLRHEVL